MSLTFIVLLLLAIAAVGLVAHFSTAARTWTLGLVAASPYLMLAAPVATLVLLGLRQWVLLTVGVLVTALCVSTQIRLFVATAPHSGGRVLTIMTANLRVGAADPSAVVRAVRSDRVDVLMVQELTPDAEHALIDAGLDAALMHHLSSPMPAAAGTGLWSRYPLTGQTLVPGFGFQFVTAQLAMPEARVQPTVVALHMTGPVPNPRQWQHDIARLPAVLGAQPTTAPVVVGGDFNATPDTAQFRAVVTQGFHDAADQAGAGLTRTYPSNRWFPPLLDLDHVITRGAVARWVRTVQIPGSDHRALVARVVMYRT